MVTSLDNLAMAAGQKNETVEKLIEMNNQKHRIIASLTNSLQAEKAMKEKLMALLTQNLQPTQAVPIKLAQNGRGWDPNGYCWSHGYKVNGKHNSKTCHSRKEGHQTGATRSNTMGGTGAYNYELNLIPHLQCHLVNSSYTTPGCTNPQNLNTTALLNTGANISLLQTGAPADRTKLQTAPKCITQPKGSLVTTESLLLLLNKLPVQARTAHQAPGISNNLLAASELADAGCELIFHKTGCEVIHNGEIILQGWRDPATCLW
ncbi:hypothetical protein ACHAW6_009155 [Cyclotella cf. meneghiniana]